MDCTIFKSVKDVSVPYHRTVEDIFNRIKNGADGSKEKLKAIRKSKNKEEIEAIKKTLPAYTFSGTFRYRKAEGLIKHSGLLTLDFDKFKTVKEAKEMKEMISEVEYVMACFISPSGRGVKAIVKIPAGKEHHKAYFKAVKEFFDHPNWDDSGSDICRLCFESYDPDIYINMDSTLWEKKEEAEVEDLGERTVAVKVTSENRIVKNLEKWFDTKYPVHTEARNVNAFKLAAALNDFGIPKSEATNVLAEKFLAKDFKKGEINTIINSAYKKKQSHGTKFFEDIDTKNGIEKMIRNGKSTEEIGEEYDSFDRGDMKRMVEAVKDDIYVEDFWTYDKKGNISVSPHRYKFWLQQHGFFKFFPEKGSGFTFICKDQNLIDETDSNRMKDFVLQYLLDRDDIGYKPYDYVASSKKLFADDFLSLLDTENVSVKKDTKEASFLYYKNCVVSVTENDIKKIDYVDIDGFVWKNQIVDREFKVNRKKSEYRQFVWLIAGKDKKHFDSLCSIIGYLCHSYKTSSHNKAIIFNDETISENPNGGSGKGLFCQALSHIKRLVSIDGKRFDVTDKFAYQTVAPDTQLLVLDDLKPNFRFEYLFSLITEGITLEYKNLGAIKLPVQNSPKVIMTTNYTIGGVGGSFERRKFEVELSDYFNADHTPEDEFGHMLFEDWDDEQWCLFDNFIIECIQYYLKNGLVKHIAQNIETRKFITETSYEFYEWTNDGGLPRGKRLERKDYFDQFVGDYPDLKRWLTQRKFSQWIKVYGQVNDIKMMEGKTNGTRWVELDDEEGDTSFDDLGTKENNF